mmetsp:Transcript_24935/g.67851  ORF Transcript_24935/g.67851 Transcript_24935/m.67851 type:complete len:112 (-) Transcript_24935:576-911(-)
MGLLLLPPSPRCCYSSTLQLGNAAAGGATSSGSRPALGATNPFFEPCHLAFIESCFKEMVTTVIKERRTGFLGIRTADRALNLVRSTQKREWTKKATVLSTLWSSPWSSLP